MCGRFTLRRPEKLKLGRFSRLRLPIPDPSYNISPSQSILAIIKRADTPSGQMLQWGLVPSWSKEAKGVINARGETLEEKPSFSESFQRRRCLIPADGFYEWRRAGRASQPYYFQMRDEAPFMFAGIWDQWGHDRLSILSCAIVTTTANELLATVHDRMPVILRPESYEAWLACETTAAELKYLLTPFPAEQMKSHPVSTAVNYPENDSEQLTALSESEVGVTPSLF
jgi:putative SOS response-associated peptidase YedK